ncbi:D-aminoacyl-tRNA deacylase [Virgibacillus sp. 179-BFC.A HS]|uniref:D-aminoacyl-tRNA deacylase n=1 Tax=Tigheibacillus jepli TaxID=3035914 RepID=A0ABU5CGN1_9BACI|nr:D-aminoacyl-tRNA deacylase [Virgibacillus sp. 179-BFC.A HS]MDY0405483.1 D-aminoacyl-tRNA deacylase [Virgibacillus sp. 179-BFC.A HS]
MKAVIQRVKNASVTVAGETIGQIENGMVVLLGVTHDDAEEDATYIVNKLTNLRIFSDEEDRMNHSLKDVQGSVLSISQFTLYADTKKGRRPSFVNAAKPEKAKQLYELFNKLLETEGIHVETGRFGAMMDVALTNDGPVTIIIDSKDK